MKHCPTCACDMPFVTERFSLKAYQNRISAVFFDGKMNATQRMCVGGFSAAAALLTHMGRHVPIQYLAYVLATTYHETARTMRPLREYGFGEGRPYGEPDPETGEAYYGRGYVQLTWKENYEKMGGRAVSPVLDQVDFVNKPDLALSPFYAAQIAIIGMSDGIFTGKKLADFWNEGGDYDYVQARRIINGSDRASTIAGYASEFEQAACLALGQHIERNLVKMGSKGGDVAELQLMLGCDDVDGIFGKDTDTKVRAFQSSCALTTDGIVGKDTWAALDKKEYGL
jgi:hypothetical protein